MSDYSNHREWVEVELYEFGRKYLSEHEEYSFKDIDDTLTRLEMIAIEAGLEGLFFKFESHAEPYEDFLGSPSVTVCGYRKITQEELKEIEERDHLEDIYKTTGVTPYEVSILKRLKEGGKLKGVMKELTQLGEEIEGD